MTTPLNSWGSQVPQMPLQMPQPPQQQQNYHPMQQQQTWPQPPQQPMQMQQSSMPFNNIHPMMPSRWNYIDASGYVQGPFPEETFVAWMNDGHFSNATLAKRFNGEREYRNLLDHGFSVNQTDGEAAKLEAWRTQDWFYMDANDVEQGPFPLDQIRDWHKADHFDVNTKVRCGGILGDEFKLLGNTVLGHIVTNNSPMLLSQNIVPNNIITSNNNLNPIINNNAINNNTNNNNNNNNNNNMVPEVPGVQQNSGITTSSQSNSTTTTATGLPSAIGYAVDGDTNQQISSLQGDLRSMKLALQASQNTEQESNNEKYRMQQDMNNLENKHNKIMLELRKTSDNLTNSKEKERVLQIQVDAQQKEIDRLTMYEKITNLYLKPALVLIEKAENKNELNISGGGVSGGGKGGRGGAQKKRAKQGKPKN